MNFIKSALRSTLLALLLAGAPVVLLAAEGASSESGGGGSSSEEGGAGTTQDTSEGSKAIINYLAEIAMRHYEMTMENMLLPAPGSLFLKTLH